MKRSRGACGPPLEKVSDAGAPTVKLEARALAAPATAVLWVTLAACGLGFLAHYGAQPGGACTSPRIWPAASTIPRESGAGALVVFLHPHCPCSNATASELERAMAWSKSASQLRVMVFRPQGVGDAWGETSLRARLERLRPGCVLEDTAGREASRFGVQTSGHVLLYDQHGGLVFSGGITGARGHEGDNAGRASLTAALAGETPRIHDAPVYGCSLRDEASPAWASEESQEHRR